MSVAVAEKLRGDRVTVGLGVDQNGRRASRVGRGSRGWRGGTSLLRSRPWSFQRIQGGVHGRIVLHAPHAPVVDREDAREAIRSSVTSEHYAVPDDEDPIEDNLTEVLVMVGVERREQRSHRFEGCHRKERTPADRRVKLGWPTRTSAATRGDQEELEGQSAESGFRSLA